MSLIILSGPTASGKSYLADLIYDVYPSKIINADSMQIYNALPILSAQPEDLNIDTEKYALYGSVPYVESYSVAKWVDAVIAEINKAINDKKIPVIVGGTGLYLKALLDGMVEIPDVDSSVRLKVREEFKKIGKEEFYKKLLLKDPKAGDKIHSNDTSRMVRAMEVYEQTGSSICDFQDKKKQLDKNYMHISLFPDREILYANCERRFDEMLKNGAMEEVQEFMQKSGKSRHAVENALGYDEIESYIKGDIDLDQAKEKAKQMTRNYAKRQVTWFRNQLPDKKCLHYKNIRDVEQELFVMVDSFISQYSPKINL